jgi:hypothetical protein
MRGISPNINAYSAGIRRDRDIFHKSKTQDLDQNEVCEKIRRWG